jgi:predicted O-methyltransferase YrrM/predicted nicotinamide N-methyase
MTMHTAGVTGLSGIVTADDVERFLRASDEMQPESFRAYKRDDNAFTLHLAFKKFAVHRRLIVPDIQVRGDAGSWTIESDPVFTPLWREGGQSLTSVLYAIVQVTSQHLSHDTHWGAHLSPRAQLPPAPPAEPRVVFNESDIAEIENLVRWCEQAQPFVEGKRVLNVAGGGGIAAKLLSRWASQCLNVDWDATSLQIGFETFDAPNLWHYWVESPSSLPVIMKEHQPDVVCWFQGIDAVLVGVIATDMKEATTLVCPALDVLRREAMEWFERCEIAGDLLVCSRPKRRASADDRVFLTLQANRWANGNWQMLLSRNTLPITVNGVLGYAVPADIQTLYDLVRYVRSDHAVVVEIGSFCGLSACIFAHSLRRHGLSGQVFCVDLWDTYVEMNPSAKETGFFAYQTGQLRQLFDHYTTTAEATGVTPICEDSAQAWRRFSDESIDLLFVDGDHSYEGCLNDLRNWYPKVKPHGIILGHDYDWDTVRAAAQQFAREKGLRLLPSSTQTMFLLLMSQASPQPERPPAPVDLFVASCV